MNPRIVLFIRGHGNEKYDENIPSLPIHSIISKMPRVGSLLYECETFTKPTHEYILELQTMYESSIQEGVMNFISKEDKDRDQYKSNYKDSISKFTTLFPHINPDLYLSYHMDAFNDPLQIRTFQHDKKFNFYDESSSSLGSLDLSKKNVFNPNV